MTKRILILGPDTHLYGGVANYYAAVMPHLHDVADYFITGHRRDEAGTVFRLLKDYIRFWNLLKTKEYSLVHLNPSLDPKAVWRDAGFLFLARLQKKKCIVFIRGWSESFERKLCGWRLRAFRFFYFKADMFIVLAVRFEQILRGWGFQGKIIVETTTVGTDLLEDIKKYKQGSRQRPGVTLLFLSRVERAKGVFLLLEAYGELKSRFPQLRLVLAGKGSALPAAQAYAEKQKMKDVVFPGYLTGQEKARQLAEADVFILPTSHGEGMPNAVLEAMAAGLPVITTPAGGIADFFEHGVMGIQIKERDVTEISNAVSRLVSDKSLYENMSAYNQRYAEDRFLSSAVAVRLRGLYSSLIGAE